MRLVFSYHKTGTTLMADVMHAAARSLGLRTQTLYGIAHPEEFDPWAGIILLPHSLLSARPERCPSIRMIRDPRAIWVSCYRYHLRCHEDWCTARTPPDAHGPITWPAVDFHLQHWPEADKRAYLRTLHGRSYQEILRDLSRTTGLAFELAHATRWTLDDMAAWRDLPGCLDVRLEDVATDFDGTMARIMDHLCLPPGTAWLAREHDVARMTDAQIAAHRTASRTPSDWRDFLKPEEVAAFEDRYGALLDRLGYPREYTRSSLHTAPTMPHVMAEAASGKNPLP